VCESARSRPLRADIVHIAGHTERRALSLGAAFSHRRNCRLARRQIHLHEDHARGGPLNILLWSGIAAIVAGGLLLVARNRS